MNDELKTKLEAARQRLGEIRVTLEEIVAVLGDKARDLADDALARIAEARADIEGILSDDDDTDA